ncbi:unnamed protein product, partial [Staurois parvus]
TRHQVIWHRTAGTARHLARQWAPSQLARQWARVIRYRIVGLDSRHRVTRYDSGHWVTRYSGPLGLAMGQRRHLARAVGDRCHQDIGSSGSTAGIGYQAMTDGNGSQACSVIWLASGTASSGKSSVHRAHQVRQRAL